MTRSSLSVSVALLSVALAGCGAEGRVLFNASLANGTADLGVDAGHVRLAGRFELNIESPDPGAPPVELWLDELTVVTFDADETPVATGIRLGPEVTFPLHVTGTSTWPLTFEAVSLAPASDALGWLDQVTPSGRLVLVAQIYAAQADELLDVGGDYPPAELCLTHEGAALSCGPVGP
jgi:hypothetical protein